ncbi:MAG: hypothetical protein IKM68_02405 [Bacteroidaceae bacterium]|nr:hypothetical protein [Bacteroidaceae bacterium]MBR6606393.1 hypothetical protein [Prevotella sp.]
MIYHKPQLYFEHYFVRFDDVAGNAWRISIQKPQENNNPVELTGAEFPVEWMGKGDESQDEVVLGSTGIIRLVCVNDTQKALFTQGALLPTSINDCRVQVKKQEQNDWIVFWQGFIVPQTFSQDWDRTPYEIELPIASVVASLEYFPMPMPGDNCYDNFQEQTNIAGLLRCIFAWSGCQVMNLLTNKPIYEDFNGQTQQVPGQQYNAHWTQGIVSASYFYENESGILKPKTFKDVVETLCYPYGKVQDYNLDVAFLMRWKDDAAEGMRMYSISVWDDYANDVYGTDVRFGDFDPLYKLSIEDIETAGTDNTHSILLAPSNVSFSSDIETNKEIFKLSESFIKSSLPIGQTLQGLPIETTDIASGKKRFLYAIHEDYVNKEFAEDWEFTNEQSQALAEYPFCRVVEVEMNTTDNTFTVTTPIPLGLCFNLNIDPPTEDDTAQTLFTIPIGVRSRYGSSYIKLKLTPYIITEASPDGGRITGTTGYEEMGITIQDLYNGKYFGWNRAEGKWEWSDNEIGAMCYDMPRENDDYVLWFHEPREAGDNSLHKLRIGVIVRVSNRLEENTYGRMYCDISLEYVEDKFMIEEGGAWTFPIESVAAAFAKGITNNEKISSGKGGNSDLNINFKTQTGNQNIRTDGIVTLPYNSFCDATKYIDVDDREMIQIEAAEYELLYHQGYFDLVTSYAVVTDGDKVFIPVAVGMNPRMNTVRLTLVSTNVTSNVTS